MEDLILKLGEFGICGIISVYLLTKGTAAIKELADSNRQLAESVNKLSERVNSMENRVVSIESEIRHIHNREALK